MYENTPFWGNLGEIGLLRADSWTIWMGNLQLHVWKLRAVAVAKLQLTCPPLS